MATAISVFDAAKAKETVGKGSRSRWWQRKGAKPRGFYYVDSDGVKLTNPESLERIGALVVPPAWRYVRINPFAGGKVQAIGVDTTGRIQYIYHPSFAQKQQRKKFAKIERLGEFLPRLKQLTNEHIALDGLPREKVLAVIMRLINSLYFRVGSDLSERHYKTYGVTTLLKKHLSVGPKGKLEFNFVGKSHVQHRKVLIDTEIASVIKELMSLGRGRRLFRYRDEAGKVRSVTPAHINRYLKDATDSQFSAKDFRTWGGTLLAAVELAEIGPAGSENEMKKNIVRAVKRVAEVLGNTPSVCRGSYIHPRILDCYSRGITLAEYRPRRSRTIAVKPDLDPEEKALLRLFQG